MEYGIKTALVTGGAGFIGSHLVAALVADGCRVRVLDNLSSGHMTNLDAVMDRIRFIKGDIEDDAVVAEACQDCDVVFHQAAVVSVSQTVAHPVGSALVNELGALKVLEAARHNSVRRVVLASSSAVYGDPPQLPKIESMAPHPLSPYAIQKLTNEHYAGLYTSLYDLQTVCLRYFNVFGPRQDPSSPYSGVISLFIKQALNGEPAVIYGDGKQTRDFVFVEDVVLANLLAATKPSAAGQVFNVGTSSSVEINALWELTATMAGSPQPAHYGEPRPGDILHSLAGIEKARQLLDFQPQVEFQDGLEQTIAWYRLNQ